MLSYQVVDCLLAFLKAYEYVCAVWCICVYFDAATGNDVLSFHLYRPFVRFIFLAHLFGHFSFVDFPGTFARENNK